MRPVIGCCIWHGVFSWFGFDWGMYFIHGGHVIRKEILIHGGHFKKASPATDQWLPTVLIALPSCAIISSLYDS